MDVFLVPVGADRHELYCEEPDDVHDDAAQAPRGFFGGLKHRFGARALKHRFSAMLADAERERRRGRAVKEHQGFAARLKARTMRWVAEAVAEQRLLWHLRRQTAATFFFPDDLDEPVAVAELRRQLARDFDKHRFWLIVDSLGFIASGVFFFVPGPNVVSYYFAFRMVGHYLSLRGAKHGLHVVSWMNEPSAPLAALRAAIALAPGARAQRLEDLAAELRLEHLPSFVERTAVYFGS
jgi:K+-H+ exchange-related protein